MTTQTEQPKKLSVLLSDGCLDELETAIKLLRPPRSIWEDLRPTCTACWAKGYPDCPSCLGEAA